MIIGKAITSGLYFKQLKSLDKKFSACCCEWVTGCMLLLGLLSQKESKGPYCKQHGLSQYCQDGYLVYMTKAKYCIISK